MTSEQQNQDEILQEIKRRISSHFDSRKIYLYGSRAKGTHRSDSDYDLVVVVENALASDRMKHMAQARELTRDLGVAVEAWVYSEEEFNDWKDELSSIPETALNTGVEL